MVCTRSVPQQRSFIAVHYHFLIERNELHMTPRTNIDCEPSGSRRKGWWLVTAFSNNKFLTNHLDSFLAWNLLFLYLTNEVEFENDILQDCISSYHLHVWFFLMNLDNFLSLGSCPCIATDSKKISDTLHILSIAMGIKYSK